MKLEKFFSQFLRAYTYELITLKNHPKNHKTPPKIEASLIPRISKHVEKYLERKNKKISPPKNNFTPVKINPYQKLAPLLNDPSVTDIECSGPGQPLSVIRFGRTEITKIILTKEEIQQFLEDISKQVHIPIIEGIFRATTDLFHIDAIISDVIGSRFVIEKITPPQYPNNVPRY